MFSGTSFKNGIERLKMNEKVNLVFARKSRNQLGLCSDKRRARSLVTPT